MSLYAKLRTNPERKEVDNINEELARFDLPVYKYDRSLVPTSDNLPCLKLSSNWHSYKNLKIIAARLWQDPSWITDRDFVSERYRKESDLELDSYILKESEAQWKSHLVCCNPYSMCYMPIDFGDCELPLWKLPLSSVNLCRELEWIASSLNFELQRHVLYRSGAKEWDEEYRLEIDRMDNEDVLVGEKYLLLELYNLALASIEYNLMIYSN